MNSITQEKNISFKIANADQDFDDARNLFREYASTLDIDLCFQGFDNEIMTIDQQYHKPKGALLLAYKDEMAIGCVGLRELDKDIAELKRLYVKNAYRGYSIGQKLLEQIIDIARELRYKRILLDTLPNMAQAQQLYRSFGFHETSSYRFNPVEGAVFMERDLS